MKKTLLFLILLTPWFIFCQVQIGTDIDGESFYNFSGYSVSLSSNGTIIAIGATDNNDNGFSSGHVRIYENMSGVWTQIGQDIDGEAAGDNSGYSVSLSDDGTIVAIGAPANDNNGNLSGQVRIYENISGVWIQIGSDILGEAVDDFSGRSVSLSSDGNIVAIGASYNDGNGEDSGHVRIYENMSGVWTQIGSDILGEAAGDNSGYSVSLSSDGNIVAIGAILNSGSDSNSGHVRIYENMSGVWTQIGQDINGEAAYDQSGYSVSLSSDGSIVAIGATHNDGNGQVSGHARIYKNILGIWTQIGLDIDGETAGDNSGHSVSLSSNANIIAIGSPSNNQNGYASGHVRIFDISGVLSTTEFTKSEFAVYPNPVSDEFNLVLPEELEIEKLIIYNNLGQFIQSSNETTVDISDLSKGIYFVEVITNTGKSVQKIIKE